jgi:hypothetical protein
MAVDIEQGLAVLAIEDDVPTPDLVEQGRRTLAVGRRIDDRLPRAPEGVATLGFRDGYGF